MGIDSVGKLLKGKEGIERGNGTFGMKPFGFNGIKPRAFRRQKAKKNTDTGSTMFDGKIMSMNGVANFGTDMPRGIIPNQEQDTLAECGQVGTCPSQEIEGNLTDGTRFDHPQKHLLRHGGVA